MKKISYLFIVITLMLVIGCQNEQEKTEEKIPVVDEFIGGTWVNDTTPDISFTLGRYVVGYENERSASADVQLHAGDTTFEGTYSIKHPYYDGYISLDDLNDLDSKKSVLMFNNIEDKNGNSFYLVSTAKSIDNKIIISKTVCVPQTSGKTEKTNDFQRLVNELKGTFSKK